MHRTHGIPSSGEEDSSDMIIFAFVELIIVGQCDKYTNNINTKQYMILFIDDIPECYKGSLLKSLVDQGDLKSSVIQRDAVI